MKKNLPIHTVQKYGKLAWKHLSHTSNRNIISIILIGLVVITFLFNMRNHYLIEIPKQGGGVSEVLLGTPRFINPVLAFSQVDKDISELVYGSLVGISPHGEIELELAADITVSQDQKEYLVTLHDDIYFHDGEPITAADVIFTIGKIKDPIIQSPERANWIGVSIEEVSEKELLFELDTPSPLFEQNLTIGILPAHIWEKISVEEFPFSLQNIQPIGSGPFSIALTIRNEQEQIVKYELTAFRDSIYRSHIDTFTLRLAQTTEEQLDIFTNNLVTHISGVSPVNINKLELDEHTIKNYLLPRTFALFFNQEKETPLANKEVRQVIDLLIDRQAIVNEVFNGYAQTSDSPLPATSPYVAEQEFSDKDRTQLVEDAKALLKKNSWSFNEDRSVWTKNVNKKDIDLSFTLQAPETDDLVITANRIRNNLAELQIPVTVLYHDIEILTQDVIRTRDYELLLFGYVTDTPADLYPFWHSSGRNDPGLNIAEYVNITVDKALDTIRKESDVEKIAKAYSTIQEQIAQDVPAAFLFSPEFIYIHSDSVLEEQSISALAFPEDRFRNIESWYVKTERILPFFVGGHDNSL